MVETNENLEFRIAKLSLGPNDTLVVKSARPLSDMTTAKVREFVSRDVPEGTKILVVDSEIELSVISPGVGLSAERGSGHDLAAAVDALVKKTVSGTYLRGAFDRTFRRGR